jgi:hypothetical protein
MTDGYMGKLDQAAKGKKRFWRIRAAALLLRSHSLLTFFNDNEGDVVVLRHAPVNSSMASRGFRSTA